MTLESLVAKLRCRRTENVQILETPAGDGDTGDTCDTCDTTMLRTPAAQSLTRGKLGYFPRQVSPMPQMWLATLGDTQRKKQSSVATVATVASVSLQKSAFPAVNTWEARIRAMRHLNANASYLERAASRHYAALQASALQFMAGQWIDAAVSAGWDAAELFGVYPGTPEQQAARIGALGLVSGLALSMSGHRIISITSERAELQNAHSTLMHQRNGADMQNSVPFWRAQTYNLENCQCQW